MAFWGVEVKSSKPYSHRLDTTRGRLHISQATLGIGSSSQRSLLQCNVGNKSPVYLCSLLPDKTESCPLNLEFEEEDEVIFSVLGSRSVHLSGFYIDKSANVHGDGDDTDSYGEDIGETESEHSTDFGTEDEYEDDFINDDDIDMFSPSPRYNSGVVIEEILDDVEPVNQKGCCKRLKRKYQVSDSEDDDQKQIVVRGGSSMVESESDEVDALPNSSVFETKDESAEIQEKPETVSEEKEIAEGGDQVITAEKENEHVQGSRTDRGFGMTNENDSTLPSSEVGLRNAGKSKRKKKKDGINEEKPRGDAGDSIVTVYKEDKSQMEEPKADRETVRDEADVKPSNDKGLGETDNSTLASFEVGQENVEKSRKKKKKGRTNEEKDRGVVGDCSVDVHSEDKFKIKEAKVDDVTQEEPVTDIYEKPSNNKGFENTYGSTLSAPEVGQEKSEKRKRKKKKLGTTEEKNDRILVGDGIVNREDRSQIVEAKSDNIFQEDPIRDEADEKPSNDKVVGKPNDSFPFYETGQETAEKLKKKKKKGGKTQLEEAKVDEIVNVHKEDKFQMEEAKTVYMSQEAVGDEAEKKPVNDNGIEKPDGSLLPSSEILLETTEKSKKKKKKERTKEGKAVGVASNDMLDVQKEDKLQMEEVKADDIMQEDPVRSKEDEKPSTDNGGIEKPVGSLLPSSEILLETTEKSKKKKKERTKEGKAGGVASKGMLDVQKEDKLQMEEAKADDIMQEDPVSSKEDEKPSTDKVVINANQVVEEGGSERKKHRKKNKNKTPDVDGNVIVEEAKEGLLVETEDRKSKRKSRKKLT